MRPRRPLLGSMLGSVTFVDGPPGILAVAAARLGAGEVLALDVEADAVAVARETVSLNGLAGAVEVRQGSVGSAAPPTTWRPRTSSPTC